MRRYVTYVYLHDIHGLSLSSKRDHRYPSSNGLPKCSHGWTLQELIPQAMPSSSTRMLVPLLWNITGAPEHILIDGLCRKHPCIAQITSWVAHWTMDWVKDWAYSLIGPLDMNLPMLYGEGKEAFHHLQLEIIHALNDQSIFAWGCNSSGLAVSSSAPSHADHHHSMHAYTSTNAAPTTTPTITLTMCTWLVVLLRWTLYIDCIEWYSAIEDGRHLVHRVCMLISEKL